MRGKRVPHRDLVCLFGITPAHAGKTLSSRRHTVQVRDHPRACGENAHAVIVHPLIEGSPPRMRGKHDEHAKDARGRGITPAHAGKTVAGRIAKETGRDHPRACGENYANDFVRFARAGSPPRMRGKPNRSPRGERTPGITPAHAGKTRPRADSRESVGDHPRACGENARFPSSSTSEKGSPPRMRGKLPRSEYPRFRTGITPAHAGKTASVCAL